MGIKMTDAPVFYTLSQIKFNPIEKMGDAISNIQEKFRKDYPDFRLEAKKELFFKIDPTNSNVETKNIQYWSFCNIERTEGYVLFPNNLVFHTTNYTSFPLFLEKIISGLKILHETIELSFVEQIGLRYLNTIQSKEGDNFDKYINPGLLGLSSAVNEQLVHNICETVFEIGNGKLVFKSLIRDQGLALPPDIQANLLNFKIKAPKGRNATLDIDFFITQRNVINIENVKNELDNAHSIIEGVFQKSISDHARKVWR